MESPEEIGEERALLELELELGGGDDADLASKCASPPDRISPKLAELCATVADAALATKSNGRKALSWAREARRFDFINHRAAFMEAKAFDELGYLAAAVNAFKVLAQKEPVSEYTQAAGRLLEVGVEESLQTQNGLPRRLKALQSEKLLNADRVKKAKENGMVGINANSPVKILNYVAPESNDSIKDASLSPSQRIKAEKVLKAYDENGPREQEGDSILFRALMARRGNRLTVVSWNAQLMNKLDGPNDAEIEQAIELKSRNIGSVVQKLPSCGLVVIQEAPGPQLRNYGGKNSMRVAKDREFTAALLKRLPPSFQAAEVALSNLKQVVAVGEANDRGGVEMGEDHLFLYDTAVLQLVDEPAALAACAADTGGWLGRAPSWAQFRVRKWDATKGNREERLLVVSVHAKSGGGRETRQDVAMIGRAVDQLKQQAVLTGSRELYGVTVLVAGDFNLDPCSVDKIFNDAGMHGFLPVMGFDGGGCRQPPATNIWRFNGSGDEAQDGHAYDSGFWSSTADGCAVEGGLAPVEDVGRAYRDMLEVGGRVRACLEEYIRLQANGSAAAASGGGQPPSELSSVTAGVVSALLEAGGDGAPSWLRKEFCRAVKLRWADHLPIQMTITMPRKFPDPKPAAPEFGPLALWAESRARENRDEKAYFGNTTK